MRFSSLSVVALVLALLACGEPAAPPAPVTADIPTYPGSEQQNSLRAVGGKVGGLIQSTTRDDFDEVVAWYRRELADRSPVVQSHDTEVGRHTAIDVPQDHGALSVAIQEGPLEGQVTITVMAGER